MLLGKVLRITASGGIPADNPFLGAGSARCNVTGRTDPGKVCQETYAWGLRNPFRLGFDPNAAGTRFFINDVGQNTWEEVDEGSAGADYGWNGREGHCATNSTTDCGAAAGGHDQPDLRLPAQRRLRRDHRRRVRARTGSGRPAYDGRYLFGDYDCGKISSLRSTGLGWAAAGLRHRRWAR